MSQSQKRERGQRKERQRETDRERERETERERKSLMKGNHINDCIYTDNREFKTKQYYLRNSKYVTFEILSS